jgi:multidrug resistance efflux pump
MPILCLALSACSSGADEEAARKEALEHAEQVAQDAEAQLQKDEAELKKNLRLMLTALDKSCDRVKEFEQVSDTRINITCSYNGETLHYVVDKTTNTVEER